MVEQIPLKDKVVGSNPTPPILCTQNSKYTKTSSQKMFFLLYKNIRDFISGLERYLNTVNMLLFVSFLPDFLLLSSFKTLLLKYLSQ